MKTLKRLSILALAALLAPVSALAQSEIYPKHFQLSEVNLTGGPLKTAQDLNFSLLMQYDVNRLLTPFVRQSGLGSTTDTSSAYYQWESKHPSFPNWGSGSFNLDGHVGGHYITALALAYAACHDSSTKAQLKERLDYCIGVLKDCQDAFDSNTSGLYGFIGGQPINQAWTDLYSGNTGTFNNYRGWVPFYCEHKILAGLRDAYLYAGSETAKSLFYKMSVWAVNLIANLNDATLQGVLDTEHGGMNETLADAYAIFGENQFLTAAKRYSHQTMVSGMQTLSTTFLDWKHANTQVPKYIGFERVTQEDASATNYATAAKNFWADVATNRTVCIGGNSTCEHFFNSSASDRYINDLDGPESCNSNNMLKLSEILSDATADAKYADFYEHTMWNHILSTQDPETGGYVYFTTLRPQGYRIYSQVNQGMWCCVGTGMENHSKYGHFIYTHDGASTVYVNLFAPSTLESDDFVLTQETDFPFSSEVTITVGKAGTYAIALRHPAWTTSDFAVKVNGAAQTVSATAGTASYVTLSRTWKQGDVISLSLPMALQVEECPNLSDYIAFSYGPILLGAQTTAASDAEAETTGLYHEALTNEYAGEGRMDHAPGSRATSKTLLSAPLLIGERSEVLGRIAEKDLSKLEFTIDASRQGVATYAWNTLTLKPFYAIHHARYMCYWYQATEEEFANSDMAATEAANEALHSRTIDFVVPGEQQSEAGHNYYYSVSSSTGNYNGENYRDAPSGGFVQFTLYNDSLPAHADDLAIMCRFTTADQTRQATLYVDSCAIAYITIPASADNADSKGFYNAEFRIPEYLLRDADGQPKTSYQVRLAATSTTYNPGLYYLRLVHSSTLTPELECGDQLIPHSDPKAGTEYTLLNADYPSKFLGAASWDGALIAEIGYEDTALEYTVVAKKSGSNWTFLGPKTSGKNYLGTGYTNPAGSYNSVNAKFVSARFPFVLAQGTKAETYTLTGSSNGLKLDLNAGHEYLVFFDPATTSDVSLAYDWLFIRQSDLTRHQAQHDLLDAIAQADAQLAQDGNDALQAERDAAVTLYNGRTATEAQLDDETAALLALIDQATGIAAPRTTTSASTTASASSRHTGTYTLSGQRVARPTRGIYIVDGTKRAYGK